MSKVLKTAALVIGAVALVATGIGAVAVAGSALAVTAATVATVATVAAGVLSLAATLTAKKPKGSDYQATGSPEQFTLDPDGPLPCIFGRFATAGRAIFRRTWDTADAGTNDRRSWVIILSLGACYSVQSFAADKVVTSFGSGGAAVGAYAGYMWQTTQLGASPEANALGFGFGAGTPPDWDSTRKLSGLCAATWTLRFDTTAKIYQTGTPAPRWVVQGVPCYDPRLDSTYPGGSGSQRANDRTTWTYSNNPHLAALSYALGYVQNGQRVFGIGAPVAQIDVAAFVEGANTSDLNGWKIGGCAFSTDKKWDTLKALLQSGMAEPLQLGAKISCFTNAPKVSLATITTDDVVGAASVTATQPRRDRINGIVPRYWQEANDWQFLSGTAVRVSDYETADGGRRTKEVDYNFIPDADGNDQIATACRYDIENAREFGPITLPLKLRWIGYKPGDCVTANLPELGLSSQTILLLNRDFDPGAGIPTFTARSETSGKHAFALGQTSVAPPTPGVSADPLVPVPGSTAWAITATQVSTSGVVVPALVVQGVVDSPVAEAIVVEYRKYVSGQAAGANWISEATLPPTATKTIITSLQPGTAYEVAISYRRRGITGNRTIYGPSTTSAAPGAQVVQGSADGTTFHFGLQTGDIYMRTSNDGGATFGTAVRIAGEGEGSGQYQQFVFKVATTQPTTPTGNGIPSGWSDGPVSGTPVWYSVATQVEGVTQSSWSTPVRLTGDPAPAPFGLIGSSGMTIVGNMVTRSAPNSNAWDQGAYSSESWVGAAQLSCRVAQSNKSLFIGLNSDPTTDNSFGSIDYAYFLKSDGTAEIRDNTITNLGAYAPGDTFAMQYNGDAVYYIVNGQTRRSLGVSSGLSLSFDSSFLDQGGTVYVTDFSAAGAVGPAGGSAVIQGSANGTTGWHSPPGIGDLYIRVSNDNGVTFGAAILIKGDPGSNGIPGTPGSDGQATFVHLAYANSEDGSVDFDTADSTNRAYLGTYTDGTLADSTDYHAYTWAKIKGDPGAPGTPAYQAVRLTNSGNSPLGTVTMTSGQTVLVGAYQGITLASGGGSVALQLQYSINGTSWAAMANNVTGYNASDSHSGSSSEPPDQCYVRSTYTASGNQTVSFRVVSSTTGSIATFDGAGQVNPP